MCTDILHEILPFARERVKENKRGGGRKKEEERQETDRGLERDKE